MWRRSSFLVILMTGAATGCVPVRDNPYDSAIAPVANLSVYDQTRPDGECPEEPVVVSSGFVVERASRGACLALDATATSDPQGKSGLTYTFSVRESEGEWEQIGENDDGILPLTVDERRRHPAPSTLQFRVVVTDPERARDSKEIEFALENSRPEIAVDQNRVFPIGGNTWDDGSDPCFDVPFDASGTTDPDRDEPFLTYAWTFVPAQDPLCGALTQTTSSQIVLRVPKSQFGRTVVTVTADDGRATSLPVTSTVGVRPAEVMEVYYKEQDSGNVVGMARIDSSFEQITSAARPSGGAARVGSGKKLAFMWEDNLGSPFLARVDSDDIETPLNGPVPFVDLLNTTLVGNAVDEDSVWVVQFGAAFTPGDEFASRWSLSGTPAISTPANVSIESWVLPEATLLTADSDSNLWVSQLAFGDVLGLVDKTTGNAIDVRTPNPERAIGGLAARPGPASEVWITEVTNIFGNGDGMPPRLIRYRTDLTFDAYELPVAYVTGIGWISETRFWLGVPGEGVWLVDASLLPEGIPADMPIPEDAILLRVPVTGDPFFLQADPISGSCSLVLVDGRGAEVSLGGAVAYQADSPYLQVSQDDGRRWFLVQGDLYRGFSVNPDGTYGALIRPSAFIGASEDVVRDTRAGGFWTAGAYGGLERYSAEGALVATRLDYLDQDTNTVRSIPVLRQKLIGEPDGSHVWAFLSHLENGQEVLDQLLRIDVTTTPPTATTVLDETEGPLMFGTQDAEDAGFYGTNAILALSDPRAQAPFAWVAHVVGQTVSIGTLDLAGNRTDLFTYPAGEFAAFYGPRGERVPVSNRLCIGVGDVGGGSPMMHVRMLDPDPMLADPAIMTLHLPLTADERLTNVVATREANGNEVCWFQVSENGGSCDGSKPGVNRVRGYRPDGAGGGILEASLDDLTNDGFRLTRGGPGSFWFESRRCNDPSPGGVRSPHVVEIQRSGGTFVETKDFAAAGTQIRELVPDE